MQIALSTLNQNIGGFFGMIDCIQGTSKATKKILSAVLLISWHCQVLTFPVSNHWQKVIPGPALTSAFSPCKAHVDAARCFWDQCVRSFSLSTQTHTHTLCCYRRFWAYLMDFTKLQMCLIQQWYNSKPATITCWLSAVCITVQMIIWLVRLQILGTAHSGEFRIDFISQAI